MSSRTLSDHIHQPSSRRSWAGRLDQRFLWSSSVINQMQFWHTQSTLHRLCSQIIISRCPHTAALEAQNVSQMPSFSLVLPLQQSTFHLSAFFIPRDVLYIACSLTLLEGQTTITWMFQSNKSCISSVPVNAVPAVASSWFFCPFILVIIALIVMPGKAYGEMESPAFFKM